MAERLVYISVIWCTFLYLVYTSTEPLVQNLKSLLMVSQQGDSDKAGRTAFVLPQHRGKLGLCTLRTWTTDNTCFLLSRWSRGAGILGQMTDGWERCAQQTTCHQTYIVALFWIGHRQHWRSFVSSVCQWERPYILPSCTFFPLENRTQTNLVRA